MGDAKKKKLQQKRHRRELGKLMDEGRHHKREKQAEKSRKKSDKKGSQ